MSSYKMGLEYYKKAFSLGLESINFQDGKFFNALTDAISDLRTDKDAKIAKGDNFFKSKAVRKLEEIIKKFTNITICLSEGAPAIYVPLVNKNHIFFDQDFIRFCDAEEQVESDIVAQMNKLKVTSVLGLVNMRESTVGGVFSEIPLNMMMPADMLKGIKYDPDEVAAIMLHETGHAFTFFEFACRQVTTNHALNNLIRVLDTSISNEQRVILFEKAAKSMELNPDRTKALKLCKNEEQVTHVIIGGAIDKCKSELGGSVYDVNSAEYLADQFAARHGAGKSIVTGLDKLFKQYGMDRRGRAINDNITWVIWLLLTITTGGIFVLVILLSMFVQDRSSMIYDTEHARFNRVRMQLIEKLKEEDLTREIRATISEEIKVIDKCLVDYSDDLDRIEKLAYYFRSNYRDQVTFERLQKDLESLASNDMFVMANRLRVLK